MEFFTVLKKRRSVRSFLKTPIEEEKINKILESANLAPSAGNLQAYEIFLVKDSRKKIQLANAAHGQNFVAEAPLVLVFCSNPSRCSFRYGARGEKLYSIQDATIATTFAMLAAENLGLASCWVGAFNDKEVLKIIGCPEGLVPVAILPIGYPAEKPSVTPRRKLEDIVHEV